MVYILKGRLLKNLLVFLRKIEDLTFFYRLPPNRGERGKNSPFEHRLISSAKIEHVGVYFTKTGGKIEDGFTDFFGVPIVGYCVWSKRCFAGRLIEPGAHITFAAKRENGRNHLAMAQPSLFFPHLDFRDCREMPKTVFNFYNELIDNAIRIS